VDELGGILPVVVAAQQLAVVVSASDTPANLHVHVRKELPQNLDPALVS